MNEQNTAAPAPHGDSSTQGTPAPGAPEQLLEARAPSFTSMHAILTDCIAELYGLAVALLVEARHIDEMERPEAREARVNEEGCNLLMAIRVAEEQAALLRSQLPR